MYFFRSELAVRGILFLIVVIPLMLIVSCASLFAPSSYRYKLTIYVATDEGMKSFSSVRQVKFSSDIGFPSFKPEHRRSQTGEAVPMELPNGSAYFGLLDDGGGVAPEYIAIAYAQKSKDKLQKGFNEIARYREEYDLPRTITRAELSGSYYGKDDYLETWPTIVSFWDAGDPRTIHIVDPDEIRIKRVTVQMTDDPVTEKVESYFPKDIRARWDRWHPSYYPLPSTSELRRMSIKWYRFKTA